jgi:hypothetical protein
MVQRLRMIVEWWRLLLMEKFISVAIVEHEETHGE